MWEGNKGDGKDAANFIRKVPPADLEEQAVAFLSGNQRKLEPHFFFQLGINPESGEHRGSFHA